MLRDLSVNDLEDLLDRFSQKYKHSVTMLPQSVELTDCFMKDGEWKGPRCFGYEDAPNFKVTASVARGHAFVKKYATNEKGRIKWVEISGAKVPDLLPFDDDFKAMSCVCVQPIENTSLYEIYEPMKTHHEEIQGFRKRHIKNLVNKLQQHYGSFDPEKDSAFMFGGSNREPHALLHNHWLRQIIDYGSSSLGMMTDVEARLMLRSFSDIPKEPVTPEMVKLFGYKRPSDPRLHTYESVLFVYKKMQAFQRFTDSLR